MRWFGSLTLALLLASSFLIAIRPSSAVETRATQSGNEEHAAADLYPFLASIAKPTAEAKIAGDQGFDRALTLSRNEKGEVVVTSLQVLRESGQPTIGDGTIALVLIHYRQCETPFGSDDSYLTARDLTVFVVGASGRFWEIGKIQGVTSIREVKGSDTFGSWEQYQKDPTKYVTYRCGG